MYIKINLLPESFYKARKKKQLIFLSAIVGGVLVVILIAMYIFKISQINSLKKEIAKIKTEQSKYTETLNKIDAIKRDKADLEERLKVINTLLETQVTWPKLLNEINLVVPANLWLKVVTNKHEVAGKSFSVEGTAVSKSAVADFLYNLQKSDYFTNVVLITLTDTGKSTADRVSFKIICNSKI